TTSWSSTPATAPTHPPDHPAPAPAGLDFARPTTRHPAGVPACPDPRSAELPARDPVAHPERVGGVGQVGRDDGAAGLDDGTAEDAQHAGAGGQQLLAELDIHRREGPGVAAAQGLLDRGVEPGGAVVEVAR